MGARFFFLGFVGLSHELGDKLGRWSDDPNASKSCGAGFIGAARAKTVNHYAGRTNGKILRVERKHDAPTNLAIRNRVLLLDDRFTHRIGNRIRVGARYFNYALSAQLDPKRRIDHRSDHLNLKLRAGLISNYAIY